MTRTEHLLTILGEECNEVAHRVSKALRFGLEEVQPDQRYQNSERVMREYYQLRAMVAMLVNAGKLPNFTDEESHQIEKDKIAAVERYLKLSATLGTLDNDKIIEIRPLD